MCDYGLEVRLKASDEWVLLGWVSISVGMGVETDDRGLGNV